MTRARAASAAACLGVAVAVAIVAITGAAPAAPTIASREAVIEFPFGSPAFVPEPRGARAGAVVAVVGSAASAPGAALPLVVFLHGLNEAGPLHRELDVVVRVASQLVDEGRVAPLLVAAPSQTRNASRPWDMWEGFELATFLAALEPALDRAGAPRVDRTRVVLVGHSGGGCNVRGSILSPRGRAQASALLAIDTCFDPRVAAALRDAPASTRVWAFFQTSSWDRDIDGFRRAFLAPGEALPERRVEKAPLDGPGAHDAILPWALRRALPALLPPPPPAAPRAPDEDANAAR